MTEITVNYKVVLPVNGIDEIAYCTSMGHRSKIKIVAFKCSSKKVELLFVKAVANYNRMLLSVLIKQEKVWFNVTKFERNIPLIEFCL